MVKRPKRCTRDHVCEDCAKNGFTPGHYDHYQCEECRITFGSLKFNKVGDPSNEVCGTVADVLKHNNSLKHVCLDSQEMDGDRLELEAVVAMVYAGAAAAGVHGILPGSLFFFTALF